MKEFRNILVATDFSESSDLAFNYALSLARKFEARLLIVHVINEPVEKLEEEIEEGAQKMMEKFCRSHLRDYENYDSFIVPGIPYDEIIKKAGEENADLIVIGTHGRTGLDHVLFGSTAEKVVRKSPIPVMTIRITESG